MHPSLKAEFTPPPSLEPKLVMGRNEPCWCGSKKKWKHCHRDRHLQKEEPIGKLINQLLKARHKGYCLHPEASSSECSSKIIKAHTVQKGGGLGEIAENGHVISGKKAFEKIFKNDGSIIPEPVGIGTASTFMGFCGKHDNKLFEPIEQQSFVLNEKAAFLLSFRALSYEYLMKQNALETIEIQRAMDKGKDFETQKAIQHHLHIHKAGLLRGMRDIEQWKSTYDAKFLAGDFSSIPHYALGFDGVLPLVCCGGFHPEVDLNGEKLQIITRGNAEMEHVCLNVSAMGNKTFAAFGWNGANGGPAQQFAESFSEIPTLEKANALLHVAVEQLENTYFKPSWWQGISESDRAHLVKRMQNGIGFNSLRPENTYKNLRKIMGEVPVSNEVGSILNAFYRDRDAHR